MKCFSIRLPWIISIYAENDYPREGQPFVDFRRRGRCFELWAGHWYVISEAFPRLSP